MKAPDKEQFSYNDILSVNKNDDKFSLYFKMSTAVNANDRESCFRILGAMEKSGLFKPEELLLKKAKILLLGNPSKKELKKVTELVNECITLCDNDRFLKKDALKLLCKTTAKMGIFHQCESAFRSLVELLLAEEKTSNDEIRNVYWLFFVCNQWMFFSQKEDDDFEDDLIQLKSTCFEDERKKFIFKTPIRIPEYRIFIHNYLKSIKYIVEDFETYLVSEAEPTEIEVETEVEVGEIHPVVLGYAENREENAQNNIYYRKNSAIAYFVPEKLNILSYALSLKMKYNSEDAVDLCKYFIDLLPQGLSTDLDAKLKYGHINTENLEEALKNCELNYIPDVVCLLFASVLDDRDFLKYAHTAVTVIKKQMSQSKEDCDPNTSDFRDFYGEVNKVLYALKYNECCKLVYQAAVRCNDAKLIK